MIDVLRRVWGLLDLPDRMTALEINLGTRMTALDDALLDFASTARSGFSQLHELVDELRTAVNDAGSGADSAIADAAARVVAATNDLESSFASFTQQDEVPVEPVPTPEPVPQPEPAPAPGEDEQPVDPSV